MNNSIVQIPRPLVKGTEGGNWDQDRRRWSLPPEADVKMECQASVPRDAFPPTPPGPEGSNGNGLLRVQWVPGAWLTLPLSTPANSSSLPFPMRQRFPSALKSALPDCILRARVRRRCAPVQPEHVYIWGLRMV